MKAQGRAATAGGAYHQLLEVVRREAVRSKADLVDLALLRIERVRRILGVVPEQTVPERRGYR